MSVTTFPEKTGILPSDPYLVRAVATPANRTDRGQFYGKTVGGVIEAHYKGSDGNEVQLTSGGAINCAVADHGALTGLTDDDHAGHPWLVGRASGQTLIGGIAASENLTLQSTAHATRGNILANDAIYIETSAEPQLRLMNPIGSGNATLSFYFDALSPKERAYVRSNQGGDFEITNLSSSGGIVFQTTGLNARLTIAANGMPKWTPAVQTSGVGRGWWFEAAAHTGLTGEAIDLYLNNARTVTFGTPPATQRAAIFEAPTYSFTGTITTAASLTVTNAPSAAGGGSITNPYAFWAQAGLTKLAGNVVAPIVAGSEAAAGSLILQATIHATQGAILFRGDAAAEYARFLATGEFLVGATALIGTELVLVRKDQNAQTTLNVRNSTSGTAARAQISVSTTGSGCSFFATSAGYTPASGIEADAAILSGSANNSNGTIITQAGALPLKFKTNTFLRMTIEGGGNVLIANELEVDGDFNHDGTNAGFYGGAPAAQAAAFAALTDSSGGSTDGTVQALTDPADAPASVDALRDDLVANLIPELRNNFAEVTAAVNKALAVVRGVSLMAT